MADVPSISSIIFSQADCTAGDLQLPRPSNACQQPRNHASSNIRPRQPQPLVSNGVGKTETESTKTNRKKESRRHSNNSVAKKNRVWGTNGDEVTHTAPRWQHNQRRQDTDGDEGGHVASRRRHIRPENNEDIATVGAKWPGLKSRETSTTSQRDVVSGSVARNIVGNR